MDAVAFVRAAGDDFAQEDDLVVPFADGDVEVFHPASGDGEFRQLVVVGGGTSEQIRRILKQRLELHPKRTRQCEHFRIRLSLKPRHRLEHSN